MEKQWQLRAAMAVADITPSCDVYLEGYEEHGELSLAHCPQDFTSDLKARVLILDNGTDRFVMVNLELLFADVKYQYGTLSDHFSDKVAAICGTIPDHVLLSNTHTHHAPRQLSLEQEDRILQAVQRAYDQLAPAVLHVGCVHTAFGVSRSRDYGIDVTRAYDDALTVLRVDTEEGAPIGLAFNVPIHNTLYGHGPDLKKNRHLLNCEFTGYACRYLESHFGGNFVAMHVNGFYGNSGPIFRNEYYAPTLEDLKQAGADFGQEILAGWKEADQTLQAGPVLSIFFTGSLVTRQDNRAFAPCFGDFEREPVLIHAGAFGELATVAVNYEPFSMIGARLKAEAPFKTLMPAAGMGWRGYIPTKETWQANRLQKEVECQPIKTPLTASAEEEFYGMLLQTVCDLQGVVPQRVEAECTGIERNLQTAVYHFRFREPMRADKIVVSFGQFARTDCASIFTITAGNADWEQSWQVSDFSAGYLGVVPENASVDWVQLTVKERYMYGTNGIDRLSPMIWAISYDRKDGK